MKRIISMATAELQEYCQELLANHREYAAAQGYEYVCHEQKHPDFADMHPVYSRLGFLLDAMNDGAERVVWADMDVAFMDYTWDIGSLIDHDYFDVGRWIKGAEGPTLEKVPGTWFAGYNQQNWPSTYICFGLTVFRNCWLSRALLAEVIRRARINPEIDNAREQYYVYDVLAQVGYHGVRACNAAEIGCFARELWNDGVGWKKGYPTVHLASAPWPVRQSVFHDEYLPLVKRA